MAASGFWGVELWTYKAGEVIGFPSLFGDAVLRDLWVPVLMVGVFIGHVPAW